MNRRSNQSFPVENDGHPVHSFGHLFSDVADSLSAVRSQQDTQDTVLSRDRTGGLNLVTANDITAGEQLGPLTNLLVIII